MFDVLLYHKSPDEILVECDLALSDKVRKHLSMYKVRRKVKIEKLSNEPIGHVFPDKVDSDCDVTNGEFGDPRVLQFGRRKIGECGLEKGDIESYHRRRFELGIPEGSAEILFDKSFPLECNLDLMGGVSFHKGCYLGQELTARTFHTGVTRKRIVPIKISPGNRETEFKTVKNRRAGKVLTVDSEGFGLALFRIEHLDKPVKVSKQQSQIFS